MSSLNFGCRYCHTTGKVSSQRVMQSHFIRCDSCFAVNALSDSQRLAMIQSAENPEKPQREQAVISAEPVSNLSELPSTRPGL